MSDSDIKFFLSLKKRVNEIPYHIIFAIIFFASNGLLGFVPFLEQGFSFGIAVALTFNILQLKCGVSFATQCHDLIEKLINRDAELIQQVNEHKNT